VSLDGLIGNSKAMLAGLLGECMVDGIIMQFDHIAAAIADQQLHGVGMVEMAAEDKRIEGLNLVGEALIEQEIEGSVDGRRLGIGLGLLQLGQQIIGADGIAMGGQQAKYLASGRSKADASLLAETLGGL
jgi:hypothetical protein